MEVSFSPIAATGKPLSRCGKCHRFMKYIQVSKPNAYYIQGLHEIALAPNVLCTHIVTLCHCSKVLTSEIVKVPFIRRFWANWWAATSRWPSKFRMERTCSIEALLIWMTWMNKSWGRWYFSYSDSTAVVGCVRLLSGNVPVEPQGRHFMLTRKSHWLKLCVLVWTLVLVWRQCKPFLSFKFEKVFDAKVYLQAKPSRLHCSHCDETYSLPQNGAIKLYKELRCPLDDFELVLWTSGARGKSYPLCPYCFSNPPFRDMKKGGSCLWMVTPWSITHRFFNANMLTSKLGSAQQNLTQGDGSLGILLWKADIWGNIGYMSNLIQSHLSWAFW